MTARPTGSSTAATSVCTKRTAAAQHGAGVRRLPRAYLVVGHQTDGKSALVEAPMGFQFNHVGGRKREDRSRSTRSTMPHAWTRGASCCAKTFSGGEERCPSRLAALHRSQNRRLSDNGFWAKDVAVRIEYKFCPNLTIIDTPGLIAAAPGRSTPPRSKPRGRWRRLSARRWRSATTLSSAWRTTRTEQRHHYRAADCTSCAALAAVSTKFDTRIPQFSRASDVELFMKPPAKLLE